MNMHITQQERKTTESPLQSSQCSIVGSCICSHAVPEICILLTIAEPFLQIIS